MTCRIILGALALGTMLVSTAAMADDPNDPTMRSAAAKARDRAMIKKLNQDQLAYVRARDEKAMARYRPARDDEYADDTRAYADDRQAYAQAREDYARDLAAWRHAVTACRAGAWEYCDN